jgi:hypothetical protein
MVHKTTPTERTRRSKKTMFLDLRRIATALGQMNTAYVEDNALRCLGSEALITHIRNKQFCPSAITIPWHKAPVFESPGQYRRAA